MWVNLNLKGRRWKQRKEWDIIDLNQADQGAIDIVYKIQEEEGYTHLKVSDLRMAQFLYFILNNKNLSNVFKATHSSVVLILGRFTEDRKGRYWT
ncbi:MAG: hypothetical protein M3342_22160 [Bacteroidota bacterium]|nr:hypothetical protein [Bacteroidota bacterium]